MTEKTENKTEALPDLDDLLQCPVCYEIPSGQIFQCNEGHHVCGSCKLRLDVCPVCRAFFFGTRNYAMEELIANVKKLRAFKLGGKVTTGSPAPDVTDNQAASSEEASEHENAVEEDVSSGTSGRPPTACKGLFRCLCCKNNPERLPLGRLLNHLRYYHSAELIEGRSENGGYLQAWQFPTTPGRVVTAVRVHDMGIFFLIIEVTMDAIHAWLSMAATPWVATDFIYSFTLSGNDREAIFSDCVYSVRYCEGTLKKRGRCLTVRGGDARALLAAAAMSGKLSVRRAGGGDAARVAEPRAVLRVASRSHAAPAHDLEPFLQDLQDDVARLSRAFATLGREATALMRSGELRARHEPAPAPAPAPEPAAPPAPADGERQLSRSARRRLRQRMREAFRVSVAEPPADVPAAAPPALGQPRSRHVTNRAPTATIQNEPGRVQNEPAAGGRERAQAPQVARTGYIRVEPAVETPPAPAPAPSSAPATSSQNRPTDGNTRNKKKRRQRR